MNGAPHQAAHAPMAAHPVSRKHILLLALPWSIAGAALWVLCSLFVLLVPTDPQQADTALLLTGLAAPLPTILGWVPAAYRMRKGQQRAAALSAIAMAIVAFALLLAGVTIAATSP